MQCARGRADPYPDPGRLPKSQSTGEWPYASHHCGQTAAGPQDGRGAPGPEASMLAPGHNMWESLALCQVELDFHPDSRDLDAGTTFCVDTLQAADILGSTLRVPLKNTVFWGPKGTPAIGVGRNTKQGVVVGQQTAWIPMRIATGFIFHSARKPCTGCRMRRFFSLPRTTRVQLPGNDCPCSSLSRLLPVHGIVRQRLPGSAVKHRGRRCHHRR